jgi:hypothetical protein
MTLAEQVYGVKSETAQELMSRAGLHFVGNGFDGTIHVKLGRSRQVRTVKRADLNACRTMAELLALVWR